MTQKIAPQITRQRLLIEGFYRIEIDKDVITYFLHAIAKHLDLRVYAEPTIFTPDSLGKEDNQGYDAFIPLIDSGISMYVWTKEQFVSMVLYTCKAFSEKDAIEFSREFFQMRDEVVSQSF